MENPHQVRRSPGSGLVVLALAASGCATFMNGANQRIPVTSIPPGAAITDNGQKVGYTPTQVSLTRSKVHSIGLRLDGYADDELAVRPQVSGWFWGNCCIFPYTPIGMVTDWINGSMFILWPEKLEVTMRRRAGATLGESLGAGAGGGKPTLAVADFSPQDVSAGNAAIIAELFRTEMVKGGTFDVVEKANMEKILAEQAFQQTGCTSQECAVKLGKVLNVRFLVVGSFGKLMDSYILNIRVVEVQTAKVVYSDSSQGKDVPAVQNAIRDMAAKLSSAVTGGT
jgi:TolB-like protein